MNPLSIYKFLFCAVGYHDKLHVSWTFLVVFHVSGITYLLVIYMYMYDIIHLGYPNLIKHCHY